MYTGKIDEKSQKFNFMKKRSNVTDEKTREIPLETLSILIFKHFQKNFI